MKTIATNKNIKGDYEILEKYEAGIILSGPEVKSVKSGQINLKGSYISFDKNNEAWLVNTHISAYKPAALSIKYNPNRRRKLLFNKKEIISLQTKLESSAGLTILPISVYNKGSLLKIQVALARGKKKADKREKIKKKEIESKIRKRLRQKS